MVLISLACKKSQLAGLLWYTLFHFLKNFQFLLSQGLTFVCRTPYYEKVVLHGGSETIPVISIYGEVALFKDCLEIIRDSGYRVAAFSDQCEIPLAEYTNVLGDNFWKIIEKIYQPKIIAIHSKKTTLLTPIYK